MPRPFARRFGPAWLLMVAAVLLLPDAVLAQQGRPGSWCVLRRHNTYEPGSCFEFLLCDTTKDATRCGFTGNACRVGPIGVRERWEVDPNAHPPRAPGPYLTWEGGDFVMTVLGRFGGDWYGCLGQKKMELPQRTQVGSGPSQAGYCILNKPIPSWPPNCFEFYLAAAGAGRAVIQQGVCLVTTQGARESWSVDANLGGPYPQRQQAQAAHDRLSRFVGNFYGCVEGGGGGGFDVLGREWVVSEGEGYRYPASFSRKGNSNVFAARFDGHADPTNNVTITISGTTVVIQRDQAPLPGDKAARRACTYRGTLSSSGGSQDLDMAAGTIDCNFFDQYNIRHNIPWKAKIIGQRRK